jgi:hypothetical protein
MKGSYKLHEEFFKVHKMEQVTWGPDNQYGFMDEQLEWFKERGCGMEKVTSSPRDLIIWDSRTIHYNIMPETEQIHSEVCYARGFREEGDVREAAGNGESRYLWFVGEFFLIVAHW